MKKTLLLLMSLFCLTVMAQVQEARDGKPMMDESLFDAVVKRGESIQQAIDKAPADSKECYKILIKKGVYNGKVVIDKPNIVLVGENMPIGHSMANGIQSSAYAISGMF